MQKIIYPLLVALVALVSFLLGKCSQPKQSTLTSVVTDTIHYTITHHQPIPKDSLVIRYQTIKLPVATDSANHAHTTQNKDSATVQIPITQKTYTDSQTYRAVISGYHTSLDTINIYQQKQVTTITQYKKQSRLSFGLQAGYGYNGKQLRPYIGVGLSYRLF